MLTVTRIGHACVLLDFAGQRILTDPWFTERPGYYRGEPLAMEPTALPELAGVVASHEHYDHCDMQGLAPYADKNVPIALPTGTGGPAREAGFHDVRELEPWQTATLGGVRVTAAPGNHVTVPEITYVLECSGFTVYFGGDTLLIPELAEVARRFPRIDLALLSVNGLRVIPAGGVKVVMDAWDAAELCSILGARTVVPIHYSYTVGIDGQHDLLAYSSTVGDFVQAVPVKSPRTSVHVLEPGQPLVLEG